MDPRNRPRDDKSLRYLLLKHKADKAWDSCVLQAYQDMQKAGDRLIESTAYYNMAVEDAAKTHEFFVWVGLAKVQKANQTVVEATANYEQAMTQYEYLLQLNGNHTREATYP